MLHPFSSFLAGGQSGAGSEGGSDHQTQAMDPRGEAPLPDLTGRAFLYMGLLCCLVLGFGAGADSSKPRFQFWGHPGLFDEAWEVSYPGA